MLAFEDSVGPVGVAFTDRAGGVSPGGLDLSAPEDGPWPHDDLRRVMAAFTGDPDAPVVRMRQVHGDRVAVVDDVPPRAPEADALVTARRGLTLLVLVADCVPVLLADPARGVVAAVHAGRAGVERDVVTRAVEQMRRLGAEHLRAWIGPHVCGRCYEVPEAMRDAVARSWPQAWAETSWGTPSLDLGAAVALQLRRAGAKVVDTSRCSRESPDLHSYRRDGEAAGRMGGLVRVAP